jgi:hypothetical protein
MASSSQLPLGDEEEHDLVEGVFLKGPCMVTAVLGGTVRLLDGHPADSSSDCFATLRARGFKGPEWVDDDVFLSASGTARLRIRLVQPRSLQFKWTDGVPRLASTKLQAVLDRFGVEVTPSAEDEATVHLRVPYSSVGPVREYLAKNGSVVDVTDQADGVASGTVEVSWDASRAPGFLTATVGAPDAGRPRLLSDLLAAANVVAARADAISLREYIRKHVPAPDPFIYRPPLD